MASKSVYRLVIKRPIVHRMMDDEDERWACTGRIFAGFRPIREDVEPSEWNLMLFVALEVWRRLGFQKKKTSDAKIEDSEGDLEQSEENDIPEP